MKRNVTAGETIQVADRAGTVLEVAFEKFGARDMIMAQSPKLGGGIGVATRGFEDQDGEDNGAEYRLVTAPWW